MLSMTTDGNRVQQILVNLLSNALKFSPVAAQIILNLVPRFDSSSRLLSCQISVRDFGIGVKPEEQALIFKPFFQTRDETSRKLNANSHGIGLSLCQKMAKLLDGSLTLISEPGKGCLFTLELGNMDLDNYPVTQRKNSNKFPSTIVVP